MKCSRLALIMFDADCTRTSYRSSCLWDLHGTTEVEIELARMMCRSYWVIRRAPLTTSSCRIRTAKRLSKKVEKSMRLFPSKCWLWMSHSLHSQCGSMTKSLYEGSGLRTTFWGANYAQGHLPNHRRLHHWRRPCCRGSLSNTLMPVCESESRKGRSYKAG
jgi:hypothetical protein